MAIQIYAYAFHEGNMIPRKYTCDGENISPSLGWSGVPDEAQSLVLIAEDPDAPSGTWVHWILFDIPARLVILDEGVKGIGVSGTNDFGKSGYGGPCPPRGKTHPYYFKLYALDNLLNLKPGARKAEVEKAMHGHILAEGQMMGKYAR